MIISDIRLVSDSLKNSIRAKITWEQADIAPDTYYFSVDSKHRELLGNPADAFLCGSIVPAFVHGEERVKVDGEVCPQLADNLQEVLFWIAAWNPEYKRSRPLKIDAEYRLKLTRGEAATLFYSGGVDAAFSLAHNRDTIPRDHPASVSRLVFVNGFDIGGKKSEEGSSDSKEAFDRAIRESLVASEKYETDLVALTTNIRHLDDRPGIWGHLYIGGAISACAHALSGCGDLFYISAEGSRIPDSGDFPHFGTHPVLDQCYSSSDVSIKHYLPNHDSRLKRVKTLKNHPILLNSLRVCFDPPKDKLNCGTCEKCVRTRLQLELSGLLDSCEALDERVTDQDLAGIAITSDVGLGMYEEIHQMMLEVNHPLGNSVKTKIENYKIYKKWKEGKTWKRRLISIIRSVANRSAK